MQGLAQSIQLGSQQRAGSGFLGETGDAVGGGLGAVSGAEGIVHVDIAQGGVFLGQGFVVFLLALVAAGVFQHHHITRSQREAAIQVVGLQAHGAAQQFLQALGHRSQRVLGLEFALFRAAQVGGDHDGGALVQRGLDGRHRSPDAGVVGDVAVLIQRDVEVAADEDFLAFQVEVCQSLEFHRVLHDRPVNGRMRHSLTREFGRQGHQGLCTDVWVAAGQRVSVDTGGSEVRLGHKAAEAHRPGDAGVSCTRQGHRRRQVGTRRQPSTLPFRAGCRDAPITWRSSAPRWCRASGWRSPTRCRTSW